MEEFDFNVKPPETEETDGTVSGKFYPDKPGRELKPHEVVEFSVRFPGKREIVIGSAGQSGVDLPLELTGVSPTGKPLLRLKGVTDRARVKGLRRLNPLAQGDFVSAGLRAFDPEYYEIQKGKRKPQVWVNGAQIGPDGFRLTDRTVIGFGLDPATATRFICEIKPT